MSGEVGFTHPLISSTFRNTTIRGRVDYGIGCALPNILTPNARRQRFQSLILLLEAKADGTAATALPQLIVYLASIRQLREARGRADTPVYGVASDGFKWIFVTITHSGLIKVSKSFTASPEGLKNLLECLRYMVEIATSKSPNAIPEITSTVEGQGDIDVSDTSLDMNQSHKTDD
ncbi:hypothetical protein BDR07DRAFT_10312 [Suillus spraguei]|nr:hypothetical protein BDR07DRAFT_10312 [Suillus spraguei]